MKKNVIILAFFTLVIFLIMLSITCVSQKEPNAMDSMENDDMAEESMEKMAIDYDETIKPIIAARCDKCHSGRSENYSSLKNDSKTKKVKNVIVSDKMPKDGPLSAENKKNVIEWLDSILGMN